MVSRIKLAAQPKISLRVPAGRHFLSIEQKRFGFSLGRDEDAARNTYNIEILGRNHIISDKEFLKITIPNKSIYLATKHQAASYFSVLERDGGTLKGSEECVHIDKEEHPDNAFLSEGIILSPETTLDELCAYLDNSNTGSNCGIGDANFMTAQAKIFPGMHCVHLHDGSEPNRPAGDWRGMKFALTCRLEECDRFLKSDRPRISSLDLDIFGHYYDIRNKKNNTMKVKFFEIARTSNIIMIFATPDYTAKGCAEQLMGEIVRHLLDDKS